MKYISKKLTVEKISIQNVAKKFGTPAYCYSYDLLKKNQPNIQLKEDLKDYVNLIYETDKKFDVIVIDGQGRFDCVKPALDCIKKDGMIILDNSDWHKNTKELLDKSDLIPVHFHGFKPLHVDSETTSCYIGRDFKRNNGRRKYFKNTS